MKFKQRDWSKIGRRVGYSVSFLLVAGVAAYVSYGHISEVARLAHQTEALARVLPLSVDGLMLIATLAMAEDKAADRMPRIWARVTFWMAAAVSVAANIASTLVHYGWDWLALAVAGWAPVALLLAIEVVAKPGKPRTSPAKTADVTAPAPAAVPATTATVPDTVAELEQEAEGSNAPVSPAPAGRALKPGRKAIPAKPGPQGRMVHAETGEPLAERTERRKRNGAKAAATTTE